MPNKYKPIDIERNDNWEDILLWFPKNLGAMMKETGAFVRARKIKSHTDLLRIILAYPVLQMSLEDISRWALEQNIADITSISIWERMQTAVPFLERLLKELLSSNVNPADTGLNLAHIDGTTISLPASSKRDYIVHLTWINGKTIDLRVTIAKGKGSGESMKHIYDVNKNAVILGDRAYGTPQGIEHANNDSFKFITRFVWNNLPLFDSEKADTKIDPYILLDGMKPGETREFNCWAKGKSTKAYKTRVVVKKKSNEETKKAIVRSKKDSKRKGYKTQKITLFMSQFICLATNLTEEEADTQEIADSYRWRWQIEREFKRFKSSTYIRKLPNHKEETVRVYILAAFIAWLISNKIAQETFFFPWGYPIRTGC
jgi:hypothetical protein